MRREFHPILLEHMRKDDRVWVITADLGYKMFDQIQMEFPYRFCNVGAAEQLMLGTAVGLAEEGKIPVCYSITPFLLFRGAEWIRNYINGESIPVKLIGGGRGNDYKHDGLTHWAGDDAQFMGMFKNIDCFWPETVEEMKIQTETFLFNGKPSYLNLKR